MDDDFEHSLLNDDALRFIRIKAKQIAGRYGFQPYEAADIQQSLILDCLERFAHFDPKRGSPRSFIRSVVNHGVANLIESQRARRRGYGVRHSSLNSSFDINDPSSPEIVDIVSDDGNLKKTGRHGPSIEQSLQLKLDVERAITALPDDLRRICRLLMVLDHVAHVATAIGVSRATLHRRMRIIRDAFAQFPLSHDIRGAGAFPGTGAKHGFRYR